MPSFSPVFQNFPGGACPPTRLAWLHRSHSGRWPSNCIFLTILADIFKTYLIFLKLILTYHWQTFFFFLNTTLQLLYGYEYLNCYFIIVRKVFIRTNSMS